MIIRGSSYTRNLMKVITWNCNMAFRKKFHEIIDENPDLIVIQECENEDKLQKCLSKINYTQIIWYGNNPNKGIAIISFNGFVIKLSDHFNPKYEYILPIELSRNNISLNLFAIWAMPNKNERSKSYVGQIWGALNYYKKKLIKPTILLGDFNSNAIWDKPKRKGDHSDVVNYLKVQDIISIYHAKSAIKHGEELEPTLYLLKKIDRPYHLDYCFASSKLISDKTSIEIGAYENWIKLSDHMPLIIDHLDF
jgi:exonuclease III